MGYLFYPYTGVTALKKSQSYSLFLPPLLLHASIRLALLTNTVAEALFIHDPFVLLSARTDVLSAYCDFLYIT